MAGLSRFGIRPLSGATFDANFRARTIVTRGVAGSLNGVAVPEELLTCFRGGVARTLDLGAVAASVPANTLRFAVHPITGVARGLVVERSSFNLLQQSNAVDAPAWTRANLTVAADAAVALDGSQTADVVTETSTTAAGVLLEQLAVSATAGGPLLWAALVHPISGATNFNVTTALSGGTATNGAATFDLINGVVIGYTGPIAAFIEPGPRGSWRVGVLILNTNNTLLTVGIGRAIIGDPPAVYAISDTAVDTQTRFPLVPSPTTNGSVQRFADDVRLPMAGQGWFNPLQGTFVIEAELFGDPAATTTLLAIRNTDAEYLRIYRDGGSNSIVCASVTAAAGGATALTLPGVDTLPARLRIAFSYKGGEFRAAMTGGKADVIDAGILQALSGALPAGLPTGTMYFGSFNGGGHLDGCIGRVAYRPSATPAADISDLVR